MKQINCVAVIRDPIESDALFINYNVHFSPKLNKSIYFLLIKLVQLFKSVLMPLLTECITLLLDSRMFYNCVVSVYFGFYLSLDIII